jgi:glycosyltransferase involved in cell wall biosynthesis
MPHESPAPLLSIVIPALNEEAGIDETLASVLAQRDALVATGLRGLEVIVVDDGSNDGTAARVARYRDVHLVRHATRQGYGAALKTGFGAATGELLAFLDADGTYPPESFATLCRALAEHDAHVVIGSRMRGRDSDMPLVRWVGNSIFAALLSVIGSQRISDSASGMRVFRRDALPMLYPLPDGLDFTPAMSTRAVYEGLRILELPIPYRERVGASKLRPLHDGVRFLRAILWTALVYDPRMFFGALGGTTLLAAVALGLGPTAHYVVHRSLEEPMIYRLFAVLILSVAGMNLLAFGFTCQAIQGLLPARRRAEVVLPRRWGETLAAVGFLMMLAGGGLMVPAGLERLRTGHVTYHWSYFAAGGTLLLTGLELATWLVLLLILQELTMREARVRRDLGH